MEPAASCRIGDTAGQGNITTLPPFRQPEFFSTFFWNSSPMLELSLTSWLSLLLLTAEIPPATRVNLDGKPTTLGAAAADLARQVNVTIDLDRATPNTSVTLRLVDIPFWESLERLAEVSNHRLAIGGSSLRLSLVGGPTEQYRRVPSATTGIFRAAVRRTTSRHDFDTGQRVTEIGIDLVWEPRFKAYFADVPPGSWQALDSGGKPLAVAQEAGGKMEVAGFGLDLSVRLPNLARSLTTLARLDGKVRLVGTAQMIQFAFDLESPGADSRQEKDGVSATLISFKKSGTIWTAAVEYAYPTDGPEFESFQSYLRDNEVSLHRADGVKWQPLGFELGTERQGRTTVLYRFRESPNNGSVVTKPGDWKLRIRTPGRIGEILVPFTLRDILLP